MMLGLRGFLSQAENDMSEKNSVKHFCNLNVNV